MGVGVSLEYFQSAQKLPVPLGDPLGAVHLDEVGVIAQGLQDLACLGPHLGRVGDWSWMETVSPSMRGGNCLEPLDRASVVITCRLAMASSLCSAAILHSSLGL